MVDEQQYTDNSIRRLRKLRYKRCNLSAILVSQLDMLNDIGRQPSSHFHVVTK